jgi:hypothetical protein
MTGVKRQKVRAGFYWITVFSITFGSQVIWQYKMDLFPVAVRGLPELFRVAGLGNSALRGGPSTIFGVFATLSLYRYSLLCTYCTNSMRRFDSGPDQILKKRPFLPAWSRSRWEADRAGNCSCSCGEGCGAGLLSELNLGRP